MGKYEEALERARQGKPKEWSEEDKLIKVLDEWLESAIEHERENVKELDDIASAYWKGQGRAIFNVMKVVKEEAKDKEESVGVAEKFARIVRENLTGIDKEVQQKFEQLYFEVTGNKMYGGYND